jgi:hypothetical protein
MVKNKMKQLYLEVASHWIGLRETITFHRSEGKKIAITIASA